jgi:hypothetical protein
MFLEEAKRMSPVTAIVMACENGFITEYEMIARLVEEATTTHPSKMNLPSCLLNNIEIRISDTRPVIVAGLEITKEEASKVAVKFNEGSAIWREFFEKGK